MSPALSAHAASEADGAVAAVIASLPVSFSPHPAGPSSAAPDVTAVAGHSGWTRRAAEAILTGSRGVVVTAPAVEDPRALAVVAEENGAAVVLDQRWAGNPALAPSHDAAHAVVAEALADAVLLDSVAICTPGEDPLTLMADHLAAVLQSGVDLNSVKVVQRSSSGYTLAGKLPNGAPAALQGIATASVPAAAIISILTSTGRTDISLPDPSAAWPAEVRSVTASGSTTLPTIYESAHRQSWRRVRRLLETGGPSTDLQQFAALSSLLTRLNS